MQVRVIPAPALDEPTREAILALCARAFREDLRVLFATLIEPVHVVGIVDGAIISHALWATRWLQAGGGRLLRTAYVEAVATEPAHRRRGHASSLLRAVIREVPAFDIAALCAADHAEALYARLGWERWRGPLFIRHESGSIRTPDDTVMIHRLPATPPLDVESNLSAEWRTGELW